MAAAAAFLLLFVLLGLGVPVAIWLLVERETEGREVVDRDAAERSVRHDDGDGPDDGWGR